MMARIYTAAVSLALVAAAAALASETNTTGESLIIAAVLGAVLAYIWGPEG